MKIITCALAILAAVSTAAVAKDLKQDEAPPGRPAVKGQVMSDSDMDKVTAGNAGFPPGIGIGTANDNPGNGLANGRPTWVLGAPGSGICVSHITCLGAP
jgi:hypothetical protein